MKKGIQILFLFILLVIGLKMYAQEQYAGKAITEWSCQVEEQGSWVRSPYAFDLTFQQVVHVYRLPGSNYEPVRAFEDRITHKWIKKRRKKPGV